jgi:hypothetical protein
MTGIFGPLAAMPQQGQLMPPTMAPPPTSGPVGSRLAQMWEAFKTDPNVRQAVLAASTQMMQSPPPGQNSLGVIGQGVQHGMGTLDALRQRDRSQRLDEERYAEQTGLKKRGVDLQEKAIDTRVSENQKDRRFRSLLTMDAQEFQAGENELNRQLQRDLARLQTSRAGRQSTHPTVHLMEERARWEYEGNPVVWDNKAAEYSEATGRTVTGQQLALLEQSRLQEQKDLFQKVNSQFYNEEEFKQRGRVLDTLLSQPWAAQMFQDEFGIDYQTFREQTLGAPAPEGVGGKAPQPRSSPVEMDRSQLRPPGPNSQQEMQEFSKMALSGTTLTDLNSGNRVRLEQSGNDFFFVVIDKNTGEESTRRKAEITELREFKRALGR